MAARVQGQERQVAVRMRRGGDDDDVAGAGRLAQHRPRVVERPRVWHIPSERGEGRRIGVRDGEGDQLRPRQRTDGLGVLPRDGPRADQVHPLLPLRAASVPVIR